MGREGCLLRLGHTWGPSRWLKLRFVVRIPTIHWDSPSCRHLPDCCVCEWPAGLAVSFIVLLSCFFVLFVQIFGFLMFSRAAHVPPSLWLWYVTVTFPGRCMCPVRDRARGPTAGRRLGPVFWMLCLTAVGESQWSVCPHPCVLDWLERSLPSF